MAAFKNKDNGTWYVQFRYIDWRGEHQQKLKRGFATKREAQEWEREFLMQKQADVNMTFESFVALYYGWAAASVSSMRYCVDCLLYLKGEGSSLEDVTDGRISDWDDIAEFNYASPYPWYFEGLVYNTQDKNDAAQACYEKALLNPAFSAENDEALSVLHVMSVKELKSVKERLTQLEDKIFASWEPKTTNYPRQALAFSDLYLRTLARECLSSEPADYKGALRHYEAALRVNPFDGDNFVGCALTQLYLGNTEKTFYYVNEGLFVDPEHEGLNNIAAILNGEA